MVCTNLIVVKEADSWPSCAAIGGGKYPKEGCYLVSESRNNVLGTQSKESAIQFMYRYPRHDRKDCARVGKEKYGVKGE